MPSIWPIKPLLSALAPAGTRARLSILIFHRVVPQPDPLFDDLPDASRFDSTMRWVKQWFNVLPLEEAVERLARDSLPARPLVITFDDGYADNEEVALPILQRLDLPATFFIATGFLDGGGLMWNDEMIEAIRDCRHERIDLTCAGLGEQRLDGSQQRRALIDALIASTMHLQPAARADRVAAVVAAAGGPARRELMMSSEQVRRLHAAGMTIGGHTVSHPILTRLEAAAARREIADGKARLEQIVGERIGVFAYPSGRPSRDYAAEHVAMVRSCGFRTAVSTAWGVARSDADRWQLPRFTPWDRARTRYGLRLAQNMLRTRYAAV